MIDFFLENGKINVSLTKDNDAVTGTPNNDAYQEIRAQINDISKKMNTVYEAMGDTSLSDEQKEAKQKEGAQLEEQYDKVIKEGVKKNITNRSEFSCLNKRSTITLLTKMKLCCNKFLRISRMTKQS